jgi:hypothetical protein
MRIREMRAEELVDLLDRLGSLGRVTREWTYVHPGQDGTRYVVHPIHQVPWLYRGQNMRHSPCFPSIARGLSSGALDLSTLSTAERSRLICDLVRGQWFCKLVQQHPVMQAAKADRLYIDTMALAQHYGLDTGYLDITESLEVALFFATCRFVGDGWQPCDDNDKVTKDDRAG